jgi:hypothetical protein
METEKETQQNNSGSGIDKVLKKTIVLNLSITNGIILTIVCAVFSLVASWIISDFITPAWFVKYETKRSDEQNSLLFLGSGTVYHYLDSVYNIHEMNNLASIPIPTLFALKALREEERPEIFDEYAKKNCSWIIMSGDEAKDKEILNENEQKLFTANIGKIFELYLNDDPLKVIAFPANILDKYIKKGQTIIDSVDLLTIYNKRKELGYSLFRTSEGSATRNVFEKLLNQKINEDSSRFFDLCTERSEFANVNGKFVILCSDWYCPDTTNQLPKGIKCYQVRRKNGNIAKKHLFLYFAAYWNNEKIKKLQIPKQTSDFIKQIKPGFKIRDDNQLSLIIKDPSFKNINPDLK